MRILVAGLSVLALAAGAATAQRADDPAAQRPAQRAEPKLDGTIFHAQVLLDRAGFSPGVIDGLEGSSFTGAIKGFQEARGLKVTGTLDQPTRAALLQDRAPSTRRLRIDESDAAGPFVGAIPDDPAAQAKMERLGYRNLLEKVAEKFHTTPATIIALNGPRAPLRAGSVLRLPNVLPASRDFSGKPGEVAQLLSDLNVSPQQPKAARVVVDKSDKVVRVLGADDRLLAQFPATLGSRRDPLPLGKWKVNGTTYNPDFHYQPRLFWDVSDKKADQMLPPGPNGPVGIVWIDLNRENIGIHGTNSPETIKRAESHGCVRLTNWDAARLSLMIENNMEVVFQA